MSNKWEDTLHSREDRTSIAAMADRKYGHQTTRNFVVGVMKVIIQRYQVAHRITFSGQYDKSLKMFGKHDDVLRAIGGEETMKQFAKELLNAVHSCGYKMAFVLEHVEIFRV